jgi:hypothetical protein
MTESFQVLPRPEPPRAVHAWSRCFAGSFMIYSRGGLAKGQGSLKSNRLPKNPSPLFVEALGSTGVSPADGSREDPELTRETPVLHWTEQSMEVVL